MKNRQPPGDRWSIKDTDPSSQNYGKTYHADFSFITSMELKSVFKRYIWDNYRTNNRAAFSLTLETVKLKKFIQFSDISGINSFREMTNAAITGFVSFLRTQASKNTGLSYSYAYQKGCLDTLKAVIHWGQIHDPEAVPPTEIFTGNEYRGMLDSIKIKYIPDDVEARINAAIQSEPNFYLKNGVVILKTTGMRVGDLMKLKTDCLRFHPVSGYSIKWYDHKNRKEHPPLPVPEKCSAAVGQLLEKTKEIRIPADKRMKKLLFIHIPQIGSIKGKICNISAGTFIGWLHSFTIQNSITDSVGNPYNLTTHMFRRTLATDMFSKGVSLKVIQDVLGHSTPMVTKRYYADVRDKENKEMFERIGVIGDISLIDSKNIPDSFELSWFRNNSDARARMCDGYCTQPIMGKKICERLLNHHKCYTCSRYITTPEFLESHKIHLRELEEQLEQNVYGEHYAAHFKPEIRILKDIIRQMEAMRR